MNLANPIYLIVRIILFYFQFKKNFQTINQYQPASLFSAAQHFFLPQKRPSIPKDLLDFITTQKQSGLALASHNTNQTLYRVLRVVVVVVVVERAGLAVLRETDEDERAGLYEREVEVLREGV